MRLARIGLFSASARRRSACMGSTDNEPQPGRHSGSAVQSRVHSLPLNCFSMSLTNACHSSRTKPILSDFVCPSALVISRVGTVSTSVAKDTLSALSSSRLNGSLNSSARIWLPAAVCPTTKKSTWSANASYRAANTGITVLQVGQSSFTKHTRLGRLPGKLTCCPTRSVSENDVRPSI